MSLGSPNAMKIRCSAKLQFRGCQRCAKLEFRNDARNWSFALHFQRRVRYEKGARAARGQSEYVW
ncbi:hypothetical protein U27_03338 [Candidatus Vecturithrix granuli]|uniref:Uncharacterized protein n=1 Tax=Vecturithrix granuli TaxID=1499967 RepID=A0A081BVM1_VECG1|nr:hypothetical protein U27_03338 [Candidatus Vecturithrix granuli]